MSGAWSSMRPFSRESVRVNGGVVLAAGAVSCRIRMLNVSGRRRCNTTNLSQFYRSVRVGRVVATGLALHCFSFSSMMLDRREGSRARLAIILLP